MKVIDLLNKIANGEEVPEIIKYNNFIYKYNKDIYDYDGDDIYLFDNTDKLNDEVEILEEEKKIPEKLNYQYRNLYGRLSQHKQSEIDIIDTLNGVIDYLKSKGE